MRVYVRLSLPGGLGKRDWHEFVNPLNPAPRTAILLPWFRTKPAIPSWSLHQRDQARIFPKGWSQEAADFAPAVIAATLDQLLAIDPKQTSSLTHAVVVLRRPASPPLSSHDRNLLWEKFGVPMFEQIVGERGKLLAAECEAHSGLHVFGGGSQQMLAAPNSEICACGEIVPLLLAAAPEVSALAASAGSFGPE